MMVTAEPRQLKALLSIVQRAPMTEAEAVFIEDLFASWFRELNQQAHIAKGPLEASADQTIPTPSGCAAGDVFSPPGAASEPETDQTTLELEADALRA